MVRKQKLSYHEGFLLYMIVHALDSFLKFLLAVTEGTVLLFLVGTTVRQG